MGVLDNVRRFRHDGDHQRYTVHHARSVRREGQATFGVERRDSRDDRRYVSCDYTLIIIICRRKIFSRIRFNIMLYRYHKIVCYISVSLAVFWVLFSYPVYQYYNHEKTRLPQTVMPGCERL